MNERERIIRLWFDMWIKKADLGIDNIFTDDVPKSAFLIHISNHNRIIFSLSFIKHLHNFRFAVLLLPCQFI